VNRASSGLAHPKQLGDRFGYLVDIVVGDRGGPFFKTEVCDAQVNEPIDTHIPQQLDGALAIAAIDHNQALRPERFFHVRFVTAAHRGEAGQLGQSGLGRPSSRAVAEFAGV
jgi:hypothetical protein